MTPPAEIRLIQCPSCGDHIEALPPEKPPEKVTTRELILAIFILIFLSIIFCTMALLVWLGSASSDGFLGMTGLIVGALIIVIKNRIFEVAGNEDEGE